MKQNTENLNVESLTDFIKRSLKEALVEKDELQTIHLPLRSDGLGLADIGAKIAKLEGKIESLSIASIIIGRENKATK